MHKGIADFINNIWPLVDTDSSGQVTGAELRAFMKKHSLAQTTEPGDAEARDVIAECDADSDGKLSKKEVIDCATAKAPQ